MRKMKGFILFLSVMMLLLFVTACGKQDSETTADANYIEVKDDLNRRVKIPKNLEKIVPLTPTMLNLLYDVGGKASARMSDSGVPINKEAENLEEVGHLANINIEKLISLKPDLVIGQIGLHERFVEVLETNDIPVVIFKIDTYEESIDKIRTFSKIIGNEEKGEQVINDLNNRIKAITDKLPDEKKRIAVIYVTPQEVTVELEESIAGGAAKILNFENVAYSNITKDMKKIPFSMEELVKQDPDIIFLTSYAMTPNIKQKMSSTLMENPAWKTLKAVKEGRVYTLPPALFAVNPVVHYDQSVEYLAKLAYPEVYGHVEE